MKRLKVDKVIGNCRECLYYGFQLDPPECLETETVVGFGWNIPDNCPLEDY